MKTKQKKCICTYVTERVRVSTRTDCPINHRLDKQEGKEEKNEHHLTGGMLNPYCTDCKKNHPIAYIKSELIKQEQSERKIKKVSYGFNTAPYMDIELEPQEKEECQYCKKDIGDNPLEHLKSHLKTIPITEQEQPSTPPSDLDYYACKECGKDVGHKKDCNFGKWLTNQEECTCHCQPQEKEDGGWKDQVKPFVAGAFVGKLPESYVDMCVKYVTHKLEHLPSMRDCKECEGERVKGERNE